MSLSTNLSFPSIIPINPSKPTQIPFQPSPPSNQPTNPSPPPPPPSQILDAITATAWRNLGLLSPHSLSLTLYGFGLLSYHPGGRLGRRGLGGGGRCGNRGSGTLFSAAFGCSSIGAHPMP